MPAMPVLETERLQIRPFHLNDETAVYHLRESLNWLPNEADQEANHRYVLWNSLNHLSLAELDQPPYGDRIVVHRASGTVIGIVGFVPYVDFLTRLPTWGRMADGPAIAAVGLVWMIAPAYQRQGYASEAGQALIGYAFNTLQLDRIIATTSYQNLPSQGVMEKLGMRLERNPFPDPPWLQVVGILERTKGEG